MRSRASADLLERVTDAIRRQDPIGLIAAGAPKNEYEPEAETILLRPRSASSASDVSGIAHGEFVRWFDPEIAGPASRYGAIGDELWNLWLNSPVRGVDPA